MGRWKTNAGHGSHAQGGANEKIYSSMIERGREMRANLVSNAGPAVEERSVSGYRVMA